MILSSHHFARKRRRGFSLLELAIVLSVFGVFMAGIWMVAGAARQKSELNDAVQAVLSVADGMRATYAGRPSVTDNYPVLTPRLITAGVIPAALVHTTTTSCAGGAPAYYADTPWRGWINGCGALNVCGWHYDPSVLKNSTACDLPLPAVATLANPAQYFGISFDALDYATCIALTAAISPTQLPGLVDVNVGVSGVGGKGAVHDLGLTLPVSIPNAQILCTPGSYVNRVVFVVTLRPPST